MPEPSAAHREHVITQEERREWARRSANRHVGVLAGSCHCDLCVLLDHNDELLAEAMRHRQALADAVAQERERGAAMLEQAAKRHDLIADEAGGHTEGRRFEAEQHRTMAFTYEAAAAALRAGADV